MADLHDLFVQSASPEVIKAYLDRARRNRDRWANRVHALTRLLDERQTQIESGEWPPEREASQ